MKSSKVSVFYVMTSLALLVALIFGGVYGIYVSVGPTFAKSSVSNLTNISRSAEVSYGGSVNFQSSMTGVILLSIVLIVLAIVDLVLLIRQIVFFKQFKYVKNSGFEQKIEKKVKSKGVLIFFVCLFNVLTFCVGIAGIFVNARAFVGNNVSWVLYVVDSLVSIFALISFVLLLKKLGQLKKKKKQYEGNSQIEQTNQTQIEIDKSKDVKDELGDKENINNKFENLSINELEYKLLKLRLLKSSKIITADEYHALRKQILKIDESKPETSENVEKNDQN